MVSVINNNMFFLWIQHTINWNNVGSRHKPTLWVYSPLMVDFGDALDPLGSMDENNLVRSEDPHELHGHRSIDSYFFYHNTCWM